MRGQHGQFRSDKQHKRENRLPIGRLLRSRRWLRPRTRTSDGPQVLTESTEISPEAPVTPISDRILTEASEPVLEASKEKLGSSKVARACDRLPCRHEEILSCTLSLQAGISSRHQLAEQADRLKQSLLVEHHALESWLKAQSLDAPIYHHMHGTKRGTLASETRHLVELYRQLGSILQALREGLVSNASSLQRFHSQQIKAKRLEMEHGKR
ncbi:hypothetical protein IAT40_003999 [Kwoniella sp. CBS 6097]